MSFDSEPAPHTTIVLSSGVSTILVITDNGDIDDTVDASGIADGTSVVVASQGGDDLLKGGNGNDLLDGGTGTDTMIGGPGNDIYVLDNPADQVLEAPNEGNDIVYASIDYTIGENVESLVLVEGSAAVSGAGNSTENALIGNSNDNILDGKGGADFMVGGAGNDIYFVDNVGDAVVENANEGNDIVNASMDYTIGANIESLVLTEGSSAINAAGNSSDNAIIGNSNDNIIDGKGGSDYMVGGAGNDVYFVDNAGDAVIENAGEGNDIVNASIDYTIGANVESLILIDGSVAIDAAGNNIDNAIFGNSNDNNIDGKGGADLMVGGLGNDTYVVDNVADQVIEKAGEGTDTVQTSVSYGLADNVDNLVLLEGGGAIDGTGNSAANAIAGNSFDNLIRGGGGADTLAGGGGNDTFLIEDSTFASIDGGDGLDRITLGSSGQSFDLTANASKISNVEIISLGEAANTTLSLADTDIPQVNASGNYLYVLGNIDDTVNLVGNWTVVATMHTNDAVAPGVNFIQYHSAATGSDLYVADTIPSFSGALDNPPTVFLDGAPDGVDSPDGPDHMASYVTGNATGVAISDVDASVNDADVVDSVSVSAHITQLTATLTDSHSGSLEFLDLTAAGQTIATDNLISVSGANTATLALSGNASDIVYQDLLREIHYINVDTSPSLDISDRHVAVAVSDGIDVSNLPQSTISLINGNHAVVDLPSSFSHDIFLV